MIPRNLKREKILYELWLQDYTTDEASSQTGIPRSSVGYYFAKFNKSKNGKNPQFNPPIARTIKKSESFIKAFYQEASVLMVQKLTMQLIQLMKAEKYKDARDLAESILLFNRVERELQYMRARAY
jgi:hypothetical protein